MEKRRRDIVVLNCSVEIIMVALSMSNSDIMPTLKAGFLAYHQDDASTRTESFSHLDSWHQYVPGQQVGI